MLSHAEHSFADIQASPTASSSIMPETIIQYTRRTIIGMTKHLQASFKVLKSTSELRKLSVNQAATFIPMLDPNHACDITTISPLDVEFDNITISSGGPVDKGLKLLENKCSPPRMVSALTLGQWPALKVSPALRVHTRHSYKRLIRKRLRLVLGTTENHGTQEKWDSTGTLVSHKATTCGCDTQAGKCQLHKCGVHG
jgi:hypothetical protein